LEAAAPHHTAHITSLAPTIMSTNGSVANMMHMTQYCSLRAARNSSRSRSPATRVNPISTASSLGSSRPTLSAGWPAFGTPSENSSTMAETIMPAYTNTSNQVRREPPAIGPTA
jgi:hypothetical protein